MIDTWRRRASLLLCAILVMATVACDSEDTTADDAATETEAAAEDTAADEAAADEAVAEAEAIQTEAASDFERAEAEAAIIANALQPWTGDLDGMIGRKMVRVAIPYGFLTYFLDGANQKGITYELVEQFGVFLKEQRGINGVTIVVIPARRDEVFAMLVDGRADVAAGTLTITDERKATVDFTDPLRTDVREVFVTGPGAPMGASLDDLAKLPIHIRRSSSFYEHLTALNAEREATDLPTFQIVEVEEYLKTEDLVEMVHAGLLPATVADEPVAEFLSLFFPDIVLHTDQPLGAGYSFGWAYRKNSPQLAEALAAFVPTAAKGSMLGNMIVKKYTNDTDWAVDALGLENEERLGRLAQFFQQYGDEYEFDWIMMAAQGYQESHLDQSKRSPVGALGIMQLLPTTAADPNVGIPDISTEDSNIHAGIKYMRFLHDRYFDDPALSELDQLLFTFGAYNAGPGNVNKARKLAAEMGLNPNVWFDNVEIAIGKAVSREPVVYVRNIYKYYVAFKLVHELRMQEDQQQ
jgi:membrane-bound lytic murein transglycosylase MltF